MPELRQVGVRSRRGSRRWPGTVPGAGLMAVSLESLDERLRSMERLLRRAVPAEPVRALSVDRVVELTGIPRHQVNRALASGELPGIPAGDDPSNSRLRVVRPADLDQWLVWRESRV